MTANNIGFEFIHPTHGPLTITERPLFDDIPNCYSSVYYATNSSGEQVVLEETLVDAVVNGQEDLGSFIYIKKPKVEKPIKTGNTKRDKAAKVIAEHSGKDLSNTAIIKAIADKLRCSKATAGGHFYALRKEAV